MSANVGLVACAKTKLCVPAPARDLYQSALFKRASAYCDRTYDRWYILSAKHGLLQPDRVIEPYDKTLKTMRKEERQRWADMVFEQISAANPPDATYYFHAGQRYREFLIRRVTGALPFEGLGIGKQLAWYDAAERASAANS